MDDLSGSWALITGASSGLGAALSRSLAARGCHLVMVARRQSRLEPLADQLRETYGVQIRVIVRDLVAEGAIEGLVAEVADLEIDVLVNNAGFGIFGPFLEAPWERERDMLELLVVRLTHLTKLLTPPMVSRGCGWVLLVGSAGAFVPVPQYTTYAASKAYVLSFGEALAYELRNTGVRVSVMNPGATATEFFEVAGQRPLLWQRVTMMQSRTVAERGLRALLRGRTRSVPGPVNWLFAFTVRLFPPRLAAAVVGRALLTP